MKVYIVIASINPLSNLRPLIDEIKNGLEYTISTKLVVVDEGDTKLRSLNQRLLDGVTYEFYGPTERIRWFQERFGKAYDKYLSIIPEKCHAETSFGFLIAWEEDADVVIELDDDVKILEQHPLVKQHLKNLYTNNGITVYSKNKWYNTIDNLVYKGTLQRIFPRGHPYEPTVRVEDYERITRGGECVLNMGLWSGDLDLDAITLLYNGGLNGKSYIKGIGIKREKVIVGKGNYFAICSMNTAFRCKVIPAFYQLYMNFMGIDRFDDIWSGLFLKKIADHLGDKICLGEPLVYHDKRPRNIFKDLRRELEGIIMNEILWKIADSLQLSGKDYYSSYQELADGLESNLDMFAEKFHRKFMLMQVQKMRLWLKIIDKIK